MAGPLIESIADTARWVATYRAIESERADALFRDPFARRLAGERGAQIVHDLPYGRATASSLIVRTAVFDDILMRLLRGGGVATVVNLAAGLDARPYRLPIPPGVRWIEVDLPEVLEYKRTMLLDEHPVVRQLEWVPLDLADLAARRQVFARIDAAVGGDVLIITEGLLGYLTSDQVATLALDLHQPRHFRWWILDFLSPPLLRWLQRTWDRQLASGGARFQFGPPQGLAFFEPYGWHVAELRPAMAESHRLRREGAFARLWSALLPVLPRRLRNAYQRMAGYGLLER